MLDLQKYNMAKNVHLYSQGNFHLAYDVNSASVHVLDESAYIVLRAIERLSEADTIITQENVQRELADAGQSDTVPELSEVWAELGDLHREGLLFTPEVLEAAPGYPDKPLIKAICLHVAHDCNLRCKYCFAGSGAFGGDRGLMDMETGRRAIDFLLANCGRRKHCEVDFFGGEPLLNYRVVKELVKYGRQAAAARDKSIKFTLTTNAVLLNAEIREFLEQEDISVVLSLDGRPEVHDRMRPRADGRGSYAEVASAIREFVKGHAPGSPYADGTYYYVRGTYTHFNPDFDQDVRHMVNLGIQRISLEPVVAFPGDEYAFRPEDLAEIKAAYDRLGEEAYRWRAEVRDISFFHFNVAGEGGPCLPKRLTGCGAGHEYVAISPQGDIYPCHQFVGQPAYKMGSLSGSGAGELRADLVQAFRNAHVYAKPACRDCWAKFLCSGGCHAANSAFTGKLTEVYGLGCALQKRRLEVALCLQAKEQLKDNKNAL